MTAIANWLNTVFAQFDGAIFEFWHHAAEIMGGFLTPFMSFITFTGESGWLMILASLIFMLFKKTRKAGICMFGAIGCGVILTNFLIKPLVARPRPFMTSETVQAFWNYIGAPAESEFCFPSGHTTSTMAAMTALVLTKGKKYLYIACPYVILMGASRNYLMAHYPTDVIAGILVGLISAIIAYAITKLIYRVTEKHKENKFFKFILEFDMVQSFKRK